MVMKAFQFVNLQLLSDSAASVSECGGYDAFCSHSDPYSCFHTVSKGKHKRSFEFSTQATYIPRRKRTKLINRSPSAAAFPSFHDVISVSPPSKTTVTLFPLSPDQPILAVPFTTVAASPPPPLPVGFLSLATTSSAPTRKRKVEDCASFPSRLRSRVSEIFWESVGSKFTLVIQKKLTQTDLSIGHCRVSVPVKKIANEFMTDGEKNELCRDGKIKIGCFVDPDMEISRKNMTLRRWKMESGCIYNVMGEGWKNVLKKQKSNLIDLAVNDVVELWSFRSRSGELCFTHVTLEGRQAAEKEEEVLMIEYGGSSSSTLTREGEESHLQIVATGDYPDIDLTLRL